MDSTVEASFDREHWLEGHSIFVQYLIVRNNSNRLDLLTLPTGDGDSLPVFASERAARAFLRSNHRGEGWHVRESTAGELISLLMGHIADVNAVVLNPTSSNTGEVLMSETRSKRDFIASLMKEPILLS